MIKPLGNNLLVKMVDSNTKEKTTQSGIIIGGTPKDKSQVGEVIEIGKGKNVNGKVVPMEVKKGDKVITSEYSGIKFKYEDIDYVIVSEDNVLAIIE